MLINNKFPVVHVRLGRYDSLHNLSDDKLLRNIEVTIDLTQWKDKISSIQSVGQSLYNDDACFYVLNTTCGLEHKYEPCYSWNGNTRVEVKLTDDFDRDLLALAHMVLGDFKRWIDSELMEIKKDCPDEATYLEESESFRKDMQWATDELHWVNDQ